MADYPNGSVPSAITFANTNPFTLSNSNQSRLGGTITNNGAGILYILLADGTGGFDVSATQNTVAIAATGYYEVPFTYRGAIRAKWSATGSGTLVEFVRV